MNYKLPYYGTNNQKYLLQTYFLSKHVHLWDKNATIQIWNPKSTFVLTQDTWFVTLLQRVLSEYWAI